MFMYLNFLVEKYAFDGSLLANTNYLKFLICIFFSLFLSCLIIFLYKLITTNQTYIDTVDKVSGFECGFASFSDSRSQFAIKFYIVAIIFLLFDLEIVLLFPLVTLLFDNINFDYFIFLNFFIYTFILWFGIYYEFKKNVLDWF